MKNPGWDPVSLWGDVYSMTRCNNYCNLGKSEQVDMLHVNSVPWSVLETCGTLATKALWLFPLNASGVLRTHFLGNDGFCFGQLPVPICRNQYPGQVSIVANNCWVYLHPKFLVKTPSHPNGLWGVTQQPRSLDWERFLKSGVEKGGLHGWSFLATPIISEHYARMMLSSDKVHRKKLGTS